LPTAAHNYFLPASIIYDLSVMPVTAQVVEDRLRQALDAQDVVRQPFQALLNANELPTAEF
jgi:hypothetical protein